MNDFEAKISTGPATPSLLGESRVFLELLETVRRLAPIDRPVVILGERGTGKELIAARLHYLSRRWDQPFIKVNCAALPESLLDAELFGHEAGAFTGAARRRVGRFEAADGGTLFLDEIGTASPSLQVKLLRVLQDREFEAVGGSKTHRVDVRLVLATNENLEARVREGSFRQDLFYRINVITITQPPLRERIGDIPLLIEHYLEDFNQQTGKHVRGFDERAHATAAAVPLAG